MSEQQQAATPGETRLETAADESAEALFTALAVPVSKLDADQYIAEDLDGVTESIFGSGNMNFLLMQAGQTDELMAAARHENPESANDLPQIGGGDHFTRAQGSEIGTNSNPYEKTADQSAQAMDRAAGIDNNDTGVSPQSSDFSSGTASAIGVSSFTASSSARAFSDTSAATSGMDGVDGGGSSGRSGINGTSGNNGTNGAPGTPGVSGADGKDGDGITIIEGDVEINLGDIYLGDINFGDVYLGDIYFGDVTNFLTVVINNFFDVLDNFPGGLGLDLDAVLSDITALDLDLLTGDTVTNLVNETIDLSPVTAPLTDALGGVLGPAGLGIADLHSAVRLLMPGAEHAPGDTDIGIGLASQIIGNDLLGGVTDVALDPVEDLIGDIDILADLGLGLFDGSAIDAESGDTDVTVETGITLVDNALLNADLGVELDQIESIIGDIDLDLGAGGNIFGDTAGNIVDGFAGGTEGEGVFSGVGNEVHALAGGILPETGAVDADAGLGLLGGGDEDAPGDSDLDLDIDINLLGTDVIEIDFVDADLDLAEDIIGDIDLELDTALDLLNPESGGMIFDAGAAQGIEGIGDLLDWPENTLPGGGAGDNPANAGDLGALLPEPVGDIAGGLGLLGGGDQGAGLGGFGGGLFG